MKLFGKLKEGIDIPTGFKLITELKAEGVTPSLQVHDLSVIVDIEDRVKGRAKNVIKQMDELGIILIPNPRSAGIKEKE